MVGALMVAVVNPQKGLFLLRLGNLERGQSHSTFFPVTVSSCSPWCAEWSFSNGHSSPFWLIFPYPFLGPFSICIMAKLLPPPALAAV